LCLILSSGIVKIHLPTAVFLLFLALVINPGCNSERVSSSPSSLREQEVIRLRAATPDRSPVVSGVVQSVDDAGRYPLAVTLVSIDGQAYYTNEVGAYRVALAPGNHQFLVSHSGLRQARTSVKVARGDSLRVNFYLRPVK
jgi:hypothetical protein